MNVIIRTDASISIGSGHVMRCLTIAKELQKRGCQVQFYMKELSGHLIEYVMEQGFSNVQEMQVADLCIIDHYEIDREWENTIRPFVRKIMVIDDLANRVHDCDLLLDQNVAHSYETRYDMLVPNHCVKLLGPKYLIMRYEFLKARLQMKERSGEVKHLLLFMGGTDPTLETLKVLKALELTSTNFEQIDVVVGNGNVHKEDIENICRKKGYIYHCQIDYMAKLMTKADFSIGAGGSTTWERCYVGLPSSSTIVANNQRIATEMAASLGAVWNLGWHEDVQVQNYVELLNALPKHKNHLKEISEIGLSMTENIDEPNPWLEKILEMMK